MSGSGFYAIDQSKRLTPPIRPESNVEASLRDVDHFSWHWLGVVPRFETQTEPREAPSHWVTTGMSMVKGQGVCSILCDHREMSR